MTNVGDQQPYGQGPNNLGPGGFPPVGAGRGAAPYGGAPQPGMPQPGMPHPEARRPDPGSPKMALIAVVVLLVSLVAVALLQQLGAAEAEKAAIPDPTKTPAQRVGPPGMDDQFDIAARLFTKMIHSGLTVTEADRTTVQGQIQQAARTPVDKFRAAVVIGEALERFDDAEKQLARIEADDAKLIKDRAKQAPAETPRATDSPASEGDVPAADSTTDEKSGDAQGESSAATEPAAKSASGTSTKPAKKLAPTLAEQELDIDIALARTIWSQGPQAISEADAERLKARHGWYGTLLTTHGESFDSGPRARMVANAEWIIVLMLGAIVVFGTAFLGGITAAAVMGVLVMQGKIKPHFRRPAPGGSVYLETAAVFVLGFLIFKVGVEPVLSLVITDRTVLLGVILALQWALLPIIFWPRLRGVSWQQWRKDVGISPVAGRSVFREIGAGIFGYFAALPLLAVAMAITILIVFARALFEGGGMGGEGGGPTPPSNPIAEMISQAPLWQLAMLFALATVWAPLVEECIFRGCLYRHVRSRLGVFLAALLTAGAFAFMHGYAAMLLLPVFTIGLIFAFIREWRGSIVSTITAHAMHNATVLGLVGALFMILRG